MSAAPGTGQGRARAGEHLERVEVTSAAELRAWLLEHHTQTDSVWLVTYKKADPHRYVSRDEVLDELVCVGWIDGARRALDEQRTMQLVGPRRVLHWAQSYKTRAARLDEQGRMQPAGLAAIEASKAAGRWEAMDDVDALRVPDDLAAALAEHPPAAERFAAFPASTRRWTLRWIAIARTERTRSARIQRTATLAARNERVPQS